MADSSMSPDTSPSTNTSPQMAPVFLMVVGLLGVIACFGWLCNRTINVVNYDLVDIQIPAQPDLPVPGLWHSLLIPSLAVLALVLLAARRTGRSRVSSHLALTDDGLRTPSPIPRLTLCRCVWPLLVTTAISLLWITGTATAIESSCRQSGDTVQTWVADVLPFALFAIASVSVGLSIAWLGADLPLPPCFTRIDRLAPVLVIAAILGSTVWHTCEQVHFWKHFLLGYADFGLFTTELEHCLPFKNVGDLRFADTRMGYHCIPMFYLLVPFYMLFRTPVFLMVVGPLALNLAAVPFYQLARDRTRSPLIALAVALAWLALPSLSRLPYSNTYGFQSIYLAVPYLAFAFSLAARDRWRLSHLCLAAAMLSEETVCGVALGWGLYLCVFGHRRRDGLIVSVVSVIYLLLCTTLIIPHFADSDSYSRLMLFGELAPMTIADRLLRSRTALFLLVLVMPLIIGLYRRPKLLIIILPTLALVLMLHQTDYLNIKYWHHTSILVALFFAAVMGITSTTRTPRIPDQRNPGHIGFPIGLLTTVLLFHQFLGHSPFSQSQRVYAAYPQLQIRDARMDAVDYVKDTFPVGQYTVIATERMAAHFTQYRMVHPAPNATLADTRSTPHVLIVDYSDNWDEIVMYGNTDAFLRRAYDAGYRITCEMGPVAVWTNRQHTRCKP